MTLCSSGFCLSHPPLLQEPWLEYQRAKDEYDEEKRKLEAVRVSLRDKEQAQQQQEGPLK